MLQRRTVWLVAAALALLVAASYAALRGMSGSRAAEPKGPAAVPVTTAPVTTKSIPVRIYAIGNVEPYTTVAVKARVDGQITGVRFKEGDEVRQGAVLFEIDARPFESSLKQAQANLLKDNALLDRAVEQEKRYKDLLEKKFISTDAYEQVRTNTETATATVRGDEAAVENARLQVEYSTIRSPITGYAGKILIQQGNLVRASDAAPLVTVNQIVPVYVTFSVPEQNVGEIRAYQAKGVLKVEAKLPNASAIPAAGRVSFVDNSADTTTGTIKLRAEFPNTDKTLWPGQFANIALTLYDQANAVVTPAAAVKDGPTGPYVFVVKPDMTVELRTIKIARTEGDDTVVTSGLAPGEQVVTTGQLRLAPGSKVSVGSSQAS